MITDVYLVPVLFIITKKHSPSNFPSNVARRFNLQTENVCSLFFYPACQSLILSFWMHSVMLQYFLIFHNFLHYIRTQNNHNHMFGDL